MNWYEIITNGSRRPSFPEDNTLYIEATNMAEALKLFSNLSGDITIRGDIDTCRKVHNVFSASAIKKLQEQHNRS